MGDPWLIGLAAFAVGLFLGQQLEALQWRHKGNHAYMNRKESGGNLYIVLKETQDGTSR